MNNVHEFVPISQRSIDIYHLSPYAAELLTTPPVFLFNLPPITARVELAEDGKYQFVDEEDVLSNYWPELEHYCQLEGSEYFRSIFEKIQIVVQNWLNDCMKVQIPYQGWNTICENEDGTVTKSYKTSGRTKAPCGQYEDYALVVNIVFPQTNSI